MPTLASDGSNTDVQNKVNAAASGDTVTIPAGSFTWTTGVTITGKALILQGAGATLTNVTDQGSLGGALLVTCTATNFVRITGINWLKSTFHSGGIVQCGGISNQGTNEVGFRFDHCKMTFNSTGGRGFVCTGIFGLVDNNTFVVNAAGSQQVVSPEGSSIGSDGGFGPWSRPLTMGTDKAVYIEDNVFDFTGNDQAEDAVDAYAGARIVIRHNTFLSITNGFHGCDSGGARSPVSFEVYNNTYTNNSSTTLRQCTVRGGTGVFFGNTYGGSHGSWNGIAMQFFRAYSTQSDWQQCNGTVWQLGSTDTSTTASRTCSISGGVGFNSTDKETLGTFGGSFTRGFDGTGTLGYPGRDQPGFAPGQVLDPVRVWSNGGAPNIDIWAGCSSCPEETLLQNFLQSGREWIASTDASAARPGYTAYTYPHPLQGGGGGGGGGGTHGRGHKKGLLGRRK